MVIPPMLSPPPISIPQALNALRETFGVNISTDNSSAVLNANIVVLAVKPQIMHAVCTPMRDAVQAKSPLIISIAAGITSSAIDRWLGEGNAIVRCMPNTPSLIRQGASGLYANQTVTSEQRQHAESILSAVSQVIWVDEEDKIDAVTAVSGSGPAYYFLVIEAMQAAAEKLGLSQQQARQLVLQTAVGATQMAQQSEENAATLRENVTSKGGTTAAALGVFEDNHLRDLFDEAMHAAAARSSELGQQLGED